MPQQKFEELEATLAELEGLSVEAEDATAKLVSAMGEMLEVVTKRSRLSFQAHRLLHEALARMHDPK